MGGTARRIMLGLAGSAWFAMTTPVDAQYFGQNKVQYEHLEFSVMHTEHFDIYYYPAEREATELAARLAERWYARNRAALDRGLSGQQPLILYESHPHFEQTRVVGGAIGVGTGGVTESLKRRIVMPMAGPLAGTDHVLGHELVHAFQYDALGAMGGSANRLPLWCIEGMAEYLSLGPRDGQTAMWLRDALQRDDLPTIDDLSSPEYFPYRYGHALWAFVGGRWGTEAVGKVFLAAAERDGSLDEAFNRVLGVDAAVLGQDWHQAIAADYDAVLQATTPVNETGRTIITEEQGGGRTNVGPALSPDGSRLMFLSERDLFSVDLYLADAHTGRVLRQVVETATDPHFDNLQFVDSAGAWSRDGQRFAVTAVRKGQPVLVLLDPDQEGDRREIPLPTLGEVTTPTWSPTGTALAFSANIHGFTDLFVYDLNSAQLRRLTRDPYTDIQPDWSPDGRRLAFVTDRFTSDTDRLAFGAYRLALLDVESGYISPLHTFDTGRQINPRWASDGRSLYFLADPDGITNIYRTWPAESRLRRVTNVSTGIAGITALSPALTVAASSDAVAFSVFRNGGYRIHGIDDPRELAGRDHGSTYSAVATTTLPPAIRRDGGLVTRLSSPEIGLPERTTFPDEPYHPRLSLESVGQPYVSAGLDPFGAFVGGGVSFLFGDMLGRHSLATQVQINGGFENLAGQASYLNQSSRWQWGLSGGQVPYVSGFGRTAITEANGQTFVVEERQTIRQTDRQLSGLVVYPFNRANRVEFSGGVRQLAVSGTVETTVSLADGTLVNQETRALDAPDALMIFQPSTAFVYDTSQFGATSPILGRRSRFEIAPWLGAISTANVLADYRQYAMPIRPWTLAGRILHYGRYGGDAEHPRLTPLSLGFPNFVRGYELDSFRAGDCVGGSPGACPAYDRLIGSRLLVGNLEVRAPLVGAFTGQLDYGPVPAELFLFADAGVAWTSETRPAFLGGSRDVVRTVGLGTRVNLFGAVIGEVRLAHPIDRPRKGWSFGFALNPRF
jgi:hypothetical protein